LVLEQAFPAPGIPAAMKMRRRFPAETVSHREAQGIEAEYVLTGKAGQNVLERIARFFAARGRKKCARIHRINRD
jgi:hypothetical protein